MAARVPVISSNAGGIPEVNIHGVTGFLSNVGDIDSMTQYSLEILQNEITLEAFKNRAKEQALKFDLESILPMYENLYLEVITENQLV